MDKVIALTVTYNRSDKLEKVITSLLKQKVELEKIIIVDNNSSEFHKKEIEKIVNKSSKIKLISLKQNTGGAGGFSYGVEYIDTHFVYDWIWIMDDDAYPEENCLKNLLKSKTKFQLEKVGFLAPLIYGIDLNKYQNYHHKYINEKTLKEEIVFENDNIPDYKLIDANAFVGPLISKEAVKEIGYPDGSLFIYGDDTEYTYRIRQRFNGYFVKEAIINHQDPVFTSDVGMWKLYYMKRNKIFFIKKYSRNYKKLILKEKFTTLKQVILALINIKKTYRERLKKARYLIKALKDGINGNSGKTVDPSIG